jgi:hypothetical protein
MSLPAILTASAALENANLVALGINHAYDEPPEVILDFPVAVRFAEATEQMEASDLLGRYNLYNFKIEVHFPRGVLQESTATALACIRAYQNLYAANLSIGSTCDVSGFRKPACSGPVWLRYGPGKVESEGIIFYMWAKEMLDDITVSLADGLVDYKKGELLKTGQTTQYGGYDDDGYYERGITKNYTVLTLGQYAGTTAIVLAGNTENHSNNCVLDNVTGLMWSRTVSGAPIGPANNGLLPWTTAAGHGIFPYIEAANVAYLAGYNDWRVPNCEELASLFNMEQPTAVPDAAAFPGWPALNVWSSTTKPDDINSAMRGVFNRGGIEGLVKTSAAPFCALVRG